MRKIFMNRVQDTIVMDGIKIVDMYFGGISGFCKCSIGDRNRYDKESSTIICVKYNKCLRSFLKKCDRQTRSDILEHVRALVGV